MDKEQIEEKIKANKSVWVVTYSDEIKQIDLTSKDMVLYGQLCLKSEDNARFYAKYSIETVFESREEAEEYLEFGDITREERLKLPTWKEINKKPKQSVEFYVLERGEFINYAMARNLKENTIVIAMYSWGEFSGDIIFEKPFTQENYTIARQLFVQLFMGEDDE